MRDISQTNEIKIVELIENYFPYQVEAKIMKSFNIEETIMDSACNLYF